jgi:hypothetical protein
MDSIYWIIILLISSLLLSTGFISWYIRKYRRSDVIIALYVVYIAMSQILAAKIGDFSIGSWEIFAPVAVIIFPFTFQLTDTINEHFGQKETHRMIFIAFISQVLMVIFLIFGNLIEPAGFWWVDNNQWLMIFGQSMSITAASWISFLLTENLDAWLYQKIKTLTKGKHLWVRSIFSDVPVLALDSVIFVTLAFGIFGGQWFLVGPTIVGQLLTKWFFGVIDTPFLYLDRYITKGEYYGLEK